MRTLQVVFAVAAAIAFGWAGLSMISLRSVGGNTVAESFDQAMGFLSFGLALISLAYAAAAAAHGRVEEPKAYRLAPIPGYTPPQT